jgi:hypothetical protein
VLFMFFVLWLMLLLIFLSMTLIQSCLLIKHLPLDVPVLCDPLNFISNKFPIIWYMLYVLDIYCLACFWKKKIGKLNTSLDTETILKGKYKLETPWYLDQAYLTCLDSINWYVLQSLYSTINGVDKNHREIFGLSNKSTIRINTNSYGNN